MALTRLTRMLAPALLLLALTAPVAFTQEPPDQHESHQNGTGHEGHAVAGRPPSDKEFSEFSHHLAGWFVIAMAAGEFRNVLAPARWAWLRLLPSIGLLGAGIWLLFWSDADTWGGAGLIAPILAGDWEAIQHKIYAVLLLSIAAIEWFRLRGRLVHRAWRWPLPLFAIAGGALLLMHMHYASGDMRLITQHHRLMGATAILAGLARLAPELAINASAEGRARGALVWAALVLMIGIELLLYIE